MAERPGQELDDPEPDAGPPGGQPLLCQPLPAGYNAPRRLDIGCACGAERLNWPPPYHGSAVERPRLDELSLGIAPIVAGPGMWLFEEITEPFPLQLAESGALSTGMLTVI